MAEITKARKGELVRGVFQVLLSNHEGLPAKEILQRIQNVVPPSAFEASEYANRPGVRRYERIIRFSTIPAVKAGWLVKDKGHWSLTEEGRQAYEKFGDAVQFMREAIRLYREWARERPGEDGDEEEEAVETATTTLEEAEEAAWSEIEAYLAEMNPFDFQELVAGLLRGMGYHIA